MHARKSQGPGVLPFLLLFLLLGGILFLVISCRKDPERVSEEPHKGQVYLYDGQDWIWMTPLEDVPASSFSTGDFCMVDGRPEYTGSDFEVLTGVDVSEHQHEIDWSRVAGDGIDFAYIRAGYRGNTEGGLFTDATYEDNLQGAHTAGLQTGVYFYSQAVNVQEALEEADYVLKLLEGAPVTLPVIYDWEYAESDGAARTDDIEGDTITSCALAFCGRLKQAGYDTGIYFNRKLGYYRYDLTRLTGETFWFALPESSWPSFYYAMDLWQFSFTETVAGIDEPVDMNLMFLPIETEPESSAAQPEAG